MLGQLGQGETEQPTVGAYIEDLARRRKNLEVLWEATKANTRRLTTEDKERWNEINARQFAREVQLANFLERETGTRPTLRAPIGCFTGVAGCPLTGDTLQAQLALLPDFPPRASEQGTLRGDLGVALAVAPAVAPAVGLALKTIFTTAFIAGLLLAIAASLSLSAPFVQVFAGDRTAIEIHKARLEDARARGIPQPDEPQPERLGTGTETVVAILLGVAGAAVGLFFFLRRTRSRQAAPQPAAPQLASHSKGARAAGEGEAPKKHVYAIHAHARRLLAR